MNPFGSKAASGPTPPPMPKPTGSLTSKAADKKTNPFGAAPKKKVEFPMKNLDDHAIGGKKELEIQSSVDKMINQDQPSPRKVAFKAPFGSKTAKAADAPN